MLKFRPINLKEYNILRKHLSKAFGLRDIKDLFKDLELIVSVGKWIEIFLVSDQLSEVFRKIREFRNPYFMGVYFGEISREKFKISLEGVTFISDYVKDKTVLNEAGEKKVLYGRDLTKKDIFQMPETVHRNDFSILINQNREVLALGKYLYEGEKIKSLTNNKILKNIIDKGWYLRKGK